ncbi:hypothetical protein [Anaeromyxobacter oryzae]|uniref:STAS/SEC14 domain-containing protein n=1 Tax=Anaeromyxobacter oryzae TaxID=2918170 RepID=A0ABM7WSA1_9BACT|nr:hypothetical protein [Anaeromyxobacter oryzae]BDG02362.1 hypothetical protein AMOR_13580 [Anaeromyxobacter oryzae]
MDVESQDGVFVVRYAEAAELAPERQTDLVAALREASRGDRVAVVFVVPAAVKLVGHDVPQHWIRVTGDRALGIAAIAVVTPNPAVSVATRALGTASILRDGRTAVKPFADEREALAWARAELARARGQMDLERPPR